MKARKTNLQALLATGLLLGVSAPSRAEGDPEAPAGDAAATARKGDFILEGFGEHARTLPAWSDEIGTALAEPSSPTQGIATALQQLYPELKAAIETSDETKLGEMAASEDPWLAAESTWHLARGLIKKERYEEAQPLMREIGLKWMTQSPRAGQALYYQGLCESELLFRDQAQDTLYKFVEGYPEESPRLLEKARLMIDDLEARQPGSIGDVADHMDTSERKLNLEDSGEETQGVQEKIVAMLDTLIEQAEEQEQQQQQQQQQQSGSSGAQQQQAGTPGNQEGQMQGGNASGQTPPKVVRRVRGAMKSAWDDLRDRKREAEALSALKSKYPPRYQQLIEQYFRDLQESAEEDDKVQ